MRDSHTQLGNAAQLPALLGALLGDLRALLAIADRKLAALRSADAAALGRCAAEETRMLRALLAAQPERDAVLAGLAQGLPTEGHGLPRPADIAANCDEPLASKILAICSGLRTTALELAQKNRLVADVARGLQSHIRGVFREVAEAAEPQSGYGQVRRRTAMPALVDAVV
jgi:FlgN protein